MVINRAYLKRLANSFNNVAIHIIEADASCIAWKDDSKWFAAVNFDHFNSIAASGSADVIVCIQNPEKQHTCRCNAPGVYSEGLSCGVSTCGG